MYKTILCPPFHSRIPLLRRSFVFNLMVSLTRSVRSPVLLLWTLTGCCVAPIENSLRTVFPVAFFSLLPPLPAMVDRAGRGPHLQARVSHWWHLGGPGGGTSSSAPRDPRPAAGLDHAASAPVLRTRRPSPGVVSRARVKNKKEDAPGLSPDPSAFLSVGWNLGFSGREPRLLDESRNQPYLLQWTICYLL